MQKHQRAKQAEFSSDDHRDHMANERTFLAWIRTAIAIMAFGFVVEKFSFFLKQITAVINKSAISSSHQALQGSSGVLGAALVGFGCFICVMAYIKYRNLEIAINTNTFKPNLILDSMLVAMIFAIGIFLLIYIINSI